MAEAKVYQDCAAASASDMQAQITRLQAMLQEQQAKEAHEAAVRTEKEIEQEREAGQKFRV